MGPGAVWIQAVKKNNESAFIFIHSEHLFFRISYISTVLHHSPFTSKTPPMPLAQRVALLFYFII